MIEVDTDPARALDSQSATLAAPPRAAAPPPDADAGPAARVGRFALIRRVGVGGMGEVHLAYDEELDRRVAVKLLRDVRQADPRERGRVVREAQAMARLSDPHVVQVYEVGEHAGQVFLAMEYVDGPTLRGWVQAEPRSVPAVLAIYAQAGRGLQAAHAAGLVHRDFKPDNVLVGRDGRARVVDFGLARSEGATVPDVPDPDAAPDPDPAPDDADSSRLTTTGGIVGTPAYMSPEQWLGEPTDARSDQFSFCAALFEALYGVRPFRGNGAVGIGQRVLSGKIEPPPPGADVPPRIAAAVRRGLAVDPRARWPDMAALLRQIELDEARDPAVAARSRRRFTLGFIVLGAASLAWVQATFAADGRPEDGALAYAALLLAVTLAGVALVRRSLMRNAFHRDMLAYLVLVVGQLFVQRLVSGVAGYPMRDIFLLDALGLTLVSAAAGAYVTRWALGIAALSLAATLLAAARPGLEATLVPLAYAASGLLFAYAWARSAAAAR